MVTENPNNAAKASRKLDPGGRLTWKVSILSERW